MKYSYKQLYIIRSSTLEKTGRIEVGQQFSTFSLSPFLKTRITFAILRFSGKTPSSGDALKILKRMTFIKL